jgi:hypothetical protein
MLNFKLLHVIFTVTVIHFYVWNNNISIKLGVNRKYVPNLDAAYISSLIVYVRREENACPNTG